MENRWLILELNDTFEGLNYQKIEEAIVTVFGSEVDYFIPMFTVGMGSYTSTSILMEGYVFVKDCLEARQGINNLHESKIFVGALFYSGEFQTISSDTVGGLKRKLRNSLSPSCISHLKRFVIEEDNKKIMVDIEKNKISVEIKNILKPSVIIPEIFKQIMTSTAVWVLRIIIGLIIGLIILFIKIC